MRLFGSARALSDPLDQWTWRNPLPTGAPLEAIAYGNGQYVAVGMEGTILTSVDGITWTQRAQETRSWLNGIAYGNNSFVSVGWACSCSTFT